MTDSPYTSNKISGLVISIRKDHNSKSVIILLMSEFAFFRFKSINILTLEEEQHKDEIVELTEEVLEAKHIECDSRIAKISEEELRKILEEVRSLRRRRKRVPSDDNSVLNGAFPENEQGQINEENEVQYIK